MKPVSILISAIGFCLASPAFAAGGITEQTDSKQLIQKEYKDGNNPSNYDNKHAVLNIAERNMALGDDAESGIATENGQSPAPLNNTPISELDNSPGWKSLTNLAKIFSKGDLVDLFL